MKKSLLWLLILLLSISMVATFSLAGCKEEAAPAEEAAPEEEVVEEAAPEEAPKITLEVAGWGPGEAAFQPVWSQIESTYESLNPNIDIELVGIAYENLRTQLIVQSTAGNAPDIAQVDTIIDLDLASLGATAPLDDLISPEFRADILPSLLENSMYQGKIHAIPQSPVPHILWLNTVLAEEAGLDPNMEIATMEDLVRVARAIRGLGEDEEGNPIWGWSIDTSWPMIVGFQIFPIFNAFGAEWFDSEGKVTIDSPANVEALTWFVGLVDEGIVGPPGVDIRETRSTFARGLSGIQTDNTGAVGIYRDLSGLGKEFDTHWRLVKWPGMPPNPGFGVYYAHSFVVFEQSQHKEEAVKFIEWLLTDPDMYRAYFEATGGPPPTMSLLEKDSTYATPFVQTIKEQMGSWKRPAPMYPGKINEILSFVGYGVSRSVIQGVDPATALNEVAGNMRLLLGQ